MEQPTYISVSFVENTHTHTVQIRSTHVVFRATHGDHISYARGHKSIPIGAKDKPIVLGKNSN